MHFLQGPFDSALGKMVEHLVPTHHYISVHDLFNPELFHSCLMAIISNIPELAPHIETLTMASILRQSSGQNTTGYIELRLHNFITIWQTILSSFDHLNLAICRDMNKESLFRMVKECDLDYMQIMLEHLFELLIRNHEVVEYITLLPEEDQSRIKDFVQKVKEKTELQQEEEKLKAEDQDEKHRLEQENIELRNIINGKDSELQKLNIQIMEMQDQIQQLKEQDLHKQNKIEALKKRLLAYEQTDTLFQQKDEQILKLQRSMTELQLNNRLLAAELTAQKSKNESRITELQEQNIHLQTKFDKIYASCDILSKQKEEIQSSNKKVIQNLKEKIKNYIDKITELQNQLVQSKISKELRQREYSELWVSYESLRSHSTLTEPASRKEQHLDRFILTSSGQNILKLGDELNDIDKIEDNAFEEQIMMFDSGEDNLKKIQQIINENARLKEKITSLESKGQKELKDENQKMRKKLAVMKKRNEQLDNQRKDELQLLVSAFDACLRNGKVEA